jgi:hypothetical protein
MRSLEAIGLMGNTLVPNVIVPDALLPLFTKFQVPSRCAGVNTVTDREFRVLPGGAVTVAVMLPGPFTVFCKIPVFAVTVFTGVEGWGGGKRIRCIVSP